jgi:hypothetical protein
VRKVKPFGILALIAIIAALAFTACPQEEDGGGGSNAVTGVILNKTTASIPVGGTETLTATVVPSDAAVKDIVWGSSNKSVATVTQSGVVNAVSVGTATITVITVDGYKTAACAVTVSDSGSNPGTGGGGLTNDIDSALAGTSWKDNINGNTITIAFTNDGITWGGTAGDLLNQTTSTYQGTGYSLSWVAKGGTISYKYSYNGGTTHTIAVYTYTLNGNTLELYASGYKFATLVQTGSSVNTPVTGVSLNKGYTAMLVFCKRQT